MTISAYKKHNAVNQFSLLRLQKYYIYKQISQKMHVTDCHSLRITKMCFVSSLWTILVAIITVEEI